jgi:hypothetical protein
MKRIILRILRKPNLERKCYPSHGLHNACQEITVGPAREKNERGAQ